MTASNLTPAAVHTMLAAGPCLVYFTKRDGTTRRMVTAPHADGCTAKNGIARVFDAEKGAWRSINLHAVTDARPLSARAHAAAPARFEGKSAAEHVADIFG